MNMLRLFFSRSFLNFWNAWKINTVTRVKAKVERRRERFMIGILRLKRRKEVM